MSYTIVDARLDEETRILNAIAEDDDITLFILAEDNKRRGNDEFAEYLKLQARKARDNQWAYDESVDN